MAITTENTATGDGSTTDFSFTFPYIKESDVKVTVTDANGDPQPNTDFSFANATTLSLEEAPLSGRTVRIFRDTDTENPSTTFFAGSAIRAQDLNNNTNQVLYSAQERFVRDLDKTGDTMTGDLTLDDSNIVFEGSTDDDIVTTLTAVDPTDSSKTVRLPNVSGFVPVLDTASTTAITATPEEINTLDGYTGEVGDLNKLDGVTDGTVAASKVVIVDSDRDIDNFRNVGATGNITASGTVTAAGGSFSAAVAMGNNKITGLGAPTGDNDAATKTYVDGVALDSSVPAGQKGADVDAVTSARWQIISVSTPQQITENLDYSAYGTNINHMLIGDVELGEDVELTIGEGSVLSIFKPG